MRIPHHHHLAYCTNIHPAESWEDTRSMLKRDVLAVRDRLHESGHLAADARFAIGLRLSARAARELLAEHDGLARFRDWLLQTQTYVFTINGFPYGDFHGMRVKERVFQPDWTTHERMDYTRGLFRILAGIGSPAAGGSVSTLPGSHKWFRADESAIRKNLLDAAVFIDRLAQETNIDLHLGLEPEPFGHFENTAETLGFFERLLDGAPSPEVVGKRIGLNYDSCHFALQYESAAASLDAITEAGIRLSKIHISSALAFDPRNPDAIAAVRDFDEPVYFHQTVLRDSDGRIERIADLPDFLAAHEIAPTHATEARVHFHIPLDTEPARPLASTRGHAADTLSWCRAHPGACNHFEIETYTWAVLPDTMRRPVDQQIAAEYAWVLDPMA
ncbi:MAG: metabolite traffic protein EboE [Luteolibacter sp.]